MSWATAGFSRSWLYAQPGLAERARGGTSGRVGDTVLGAVSWLSSVFPAQRLRSRGRVRMICQSPVRVRK